MQELKGYRIGGKRAGVERVHRKGGKGGRKREGGSWGNYTLYRKCVSSEVKYFFIFGCTRANQSCPNNAALLRFIVSALSMVGLFIIWD